MSPSRQPILEAIRRANAGAGAASAGSAAPRPALPGPVLETFTARAHAASATCEHAADWNGVAAAVHAYLAREGLAAITVASAAPLHGLAITGARRRPIMPEDRAALTVAAAAVAETGSVVLVSDAATPTALNLLPEHLLVAVETTTLVPHLEDLWALLRRRHGILPRAVNLITGPSRTADVEQIIQLGAHGARRLHLLLVGGDDGTHNGKESDP